MEQLAGVAGVAATLSRVQFEAEYQAAALRKQQAVAQDIGHAALELIQAAIIDPHVGQHLDVSA